MKKLLAILSVTGFLLACNPGNEKEKNAVTDPVTENHPEHAEKATGLILNNGAKWKADSTTWVNAANLQTIVSGAKKESPENYLQTSTRLLEGLDKMVKECKMQGADHDALHQWLMPLMEKTKNLKTVTSVENAATILLEIEKKVNLFPQYFEK
ncbi:MAG TPA: hypothetical protein VI548_06260 [Chitinophagaceae bacterium]|nr:hypothetical protein [Chitinophagaceae bacterium]